MRQRLIGTVVWMTIHSANDELIAHLLGGRADESTVFGRFGGDLNLPNASGMTPAMAAVVNSTPSVLRLLFENGAAASQELLDFADRSYSHKPEMRAEIIAATMAAIIGGSSSDQLPNTPRRRRMDL